VSLKPLALLFFPICVLAQWFPFQDGTDDLRGRRPGEDIQADRFDPTNDQQIQRGRFNRPLTVELPEKPQAKPISGIVSLRELQHPPSKRALRLFQEALRYSQTHDTVKAIGKLEEAIRIAPAFGEAQQKLGVQYARSGRTREAMKQFETALEIGPPDAKAYSNLGWCYVRLGQFHQAQDLARKALSLDQNNGPARTLLQVASSH
jgi:Flp pilus assembly protein TadD